MFNLTESVLEERIDMFEECNKLIKKNKGKMYVCGLKDKNLRLINDITNGLRIYKELNEC